MVNIHVFPKAFNSEKSGKKKNIISKFQRNTYFLVNGQGEDLRVEKTLDIGQHSQKNFFFLKRSFGSERKKKWLLRRRAYESFLLKHLEFNNLKQEKY